MTYPADFLNEVQEIANNIDKNQIENIIGLIQSVRTNGGRMFFLGVGGSAANCSHAVNDFRKLAQIESYTPVDNVSELTARTNDEGWDTIFEEWLKGSKLNVNDLIFIFSVGGGSREKKISENLVNAMDYAKECGAKIAGIVGRDGGYTEKMADACILIPSFNPETVTPQAEAWQGIILHLIVSDPRIRRIKNKWESLYV